MYIPNKFRQENIEQLLGVVEQYPFATLTAQSEDGIEAVHLPLMLEQVDDKLLLKGHIAKANPLWKKVHSGSNVLVIFHGPNCYISPNHYPTKLENGRAVPTWNYVVVHAKGAISFIKDVDWIYSMIDQLTAQHEVNSPYPWSISDAPDGFIEKMLPAIVGIEIKLRAIEGQWKLSQNQPEVNQQGVVNGLSALNEPSALEVASWVRAQGK
ncbi:FMN-binding negative transcriptional regulator [Vibrio comitans]|uniref:Transcriptional regulator n=1 Tax=Vibrio comitans NBRC 102076 TaxID=1219078 RepID=A0A4Y3IIT0_9VIBR|nr:FMN-binding negative transcriptional regulator [Vibrio comitans]GEA59351.1 transcriptional regulator [Vibrio comitans NBRC 102076]